MSRSGICGEIWKGLGRSGEMCLSWDLQGELEGWRRPGWWWPAGQRWWHGRAAATRPTPATRARWPPSRSRPASRDLREAGVAQPLAHQAKRVQAPAAAEPVARARAMRRPQWLEGVELPDVRHRGGLERNGRRLGHSSGTGGASCVEEALVGRPGDTPHEQQIPPCCVAQHHRLERSPPAPRHAVEQRRLRAGRRGPVH